MFGKNLNILPKQREFCDNVGENLTLFSYCVLHHFTFAARTVGKKIVCEEEKKINFSIHTKSLSEVFKMAVFW